MKVLLLESPGNLQLKYVPSELSARSAAIAWNVEHTGNSAITSYEIQFKHILLTSKQQIDFGIRTKGNQSLINQSSYGGDSSNFTHLDQDSLFKRLRNESEDDEFWSQANVQFLSSNEVQESLSNSLIKANNVPLQGQYNLNKLEPSSLYLVRMRAQNQLGFSKFSNVIFIFTKKEAPSISKYITFWTLES